MEEITNEDLERIKPHGVVLGFLNPGSSEEVEQIVRLLTGRADDDFRFAYSYSNCFNLQPISSTETRFVIRIFNYGDLDAELVYLRLIIWTKAGAIFTKRIKQVLRINGTRNEIFDWTLKNREDLGVNELSEILNVYAIVADPVSDPFETRLNEFIQKGAKGDYWLDINPCRYSRKIASFNLSTYSNGQFDPSNLPFEVKGNQILYTGRGHFDIILDKQDALDNASFGMLVNGKEIMLVEYIKDKRNRVLNTVKSSETELVFILFTRNSRLSTNTSYCRIPTQGKCREIKLEWEDGNDNDYNDYVIKIIHR